MKNFLTKNIGWKIISLVAAVLLWLVVTNINDPTINQDYSNVKIVCENTDVLGNDIVYDYEKDAMTTTVTVTAPRSVINELDKSEIVASLNFATLDVKNLQPEVPIPIDIKLPENTGNDAEFSVKPNTVNVKFDKVKKKTVMLNYDLTGEPADGYYNPYYAVLDQNQVRISGPESIIDEVYQATAIIDISDGSKADISSQYDIKFFDRTGNAVDSSKITSNIKTVGVTIPIFKLVEVPVRVSYSGTPADGYRVTGTPTASKESVEVYGKEYDLEGLKEILIGKESVNIDGMTDSYVASFSVNDFLPNGVYLKNEDDEIIEINVDIEEEKVKDIPITSEDISIVNVPEGLKVSNLMIPDGTVLKICGLERDVTPLNKSSVNPMIDIGEYVSDWLTEHDKTSIKDDFYTIPVKLSPNVSSIASLKESVSATVQIQNLNADE